MDASAKNVDDEDFPSELQDRLSNFDDTLGKIEEVFSPLQNVPLSQVHVDMSAIEKAKLDLIGVYAVNSLFWMYLNVKGENPKEHGIKQELDRIRSYMNRVREIEEKAKAPKLDKDASKRFIKSALWQQAHKQTVKKQEDKPEGPQPSSSSKSTDSMDVDNDGPTAAKRSKGEKRKKKKNKHDK